MKLLAMLIASTVVAVYWGWIAGAAVLAAGVVVQMSLLAATGSKEKGPNL